MSVTPSCRDFHPRQSSGWSRTEFTSQRPSFDKYRQPEIEIVWALCRAEVKESRTRFKDKSSNTASSTVECQCLLQRSRSGHVSDHDQSNLSRRGAIEHQQRQTNGIFFRLPWRTLAYACSIKMNNPRIAVDRHAHAVHEVCNNANFFALIILTTGSVGSLCRHRIILFFQYRSQFPGVDCRIFTRSLCVIQASSMAKRLAGFSRSDGE